MDDLKAILDAAAKEVTVDCWADIQPLREAFCRTSLSSGPFTHRLERMAPDLAAEVLRLREALKLYANPQNWKMSGPCDPNGPNFIGEEHARAALAERKEG